MRGFSLQLFPSSNTLLGFNYQTGEFEDETNKTVLFSEISFGLIFIVFHYSWTKGLKEKESN